ncbi:MAG: hypothetical protein WCK00_00290 [Deltaproteobacteria bacterium]
MRFHFSEPFIKVAGPELEFTISSPVSLRVLIGQFPPDIIKMIPVLRTAKPFDKLRANGCGSGIEGHHDDSVTDVELWAHVMFFNKVRLLRLDDMIDNDETIKVLLPATGG